MTDGRCAPHRTLLRNTRGRAHSHIELYNKPVVYGVYASERLSLRDTGKIIGAYGNVECGHWLRPWASRPHYDDTMRCTLGRAFFKYPSRIWMPLRQRCVRLVSTARSRTWPAPSAVRSDDHQIVIRSTSSSVIPSPVRSCAGRPESVAADLEMHAQVGRAAPDQR